MASVSLARLTCLCGALSLPGSLLADADIPATAEICHCDSCRHTTGSLCSSFVLLKSAPQKNTFSELKAYGTSNKVIRYYCYVCGCYCFFHNRHLKQWFCLSGIIEPTSVPGATNPAWPKDTIKVLHHEHVLDTGDGGLAPALLSLSGRSIPTWCAGRQQSSQTLSYDLPHARVLSLPRTSTSNTKPPELDSYLRASCDCNGVSLLIKRASYSPIPESTVQARYVSRDPTKYRAYICACRSCRLTTGVALVPWALIPLANIFNAKAPGKLPNPNDPLPVVAGQAASDPESNPHLALTHHWSSPDVCRSFCRQCGATVFYWSAQRPDEVDVAVGIMRAEEGAMARLWLDWEWGRCSFVEEAMDEGVSEAWLGCAEVMDVK